ncbi:hypothetical protein Cni_G15943 [Canna indica]|uniref:Bifunctional inhibitor/plant lipid transfer protein/seed storage helical domain-containing protein n=1 Tax=Canna indica TaxID=4628 RepID=A0AAQ3KGZ9_9LILI|nr:hypothetical protein Cni_G15943 [Canna indica]
MKCSNLVVFFCAMSVLALLRAPTAVESATCSIAQLTPCAAAILSSAEPSSACCSRLQEQSSCLCEYKNDPSLSIYFTAGQKVAAACKITVPSCD